MKMKAFAGMIGFALALIWTAGVLASCGPGPRAQLDPAGDLAALSATWGPLHLLEGEIVRVSPGLILLAGGGRSELLALGDRAEIYVNGRLGVLEALRPVTEDCRFIARLWLDGSGKVLLVDARYEGAEVEILAVELLEDGRYRFKLRFLEDEEGKETTVETAAGCRGLKGRSPADLLGEAFILYDLEGRIRGFFLPFPSRKRKDPAGEMSKKMKTFPDLHGGGEIRWPRLE